MKPMSKDKNLEWVQILGSCNGLLLVSHYTDLYLWNSSTRQWTKSALTSKWWLWDGVYVVKNELSTSSVLCYDFSSEFKVLMACHGKVDVASFREKKWVTTTCHLTEEMNSRLVVNGKLHWLIHQDDFPTDRIIYFDPITDEFLELPAPPRPYSFRESVTFIYGLRVLEGCLCMVCRSCESGAEVEHGFIDVFVMTEYGVGESWARIFVMSRLTVLFEYGNLVSLCFLKSGEALIAMNKNKLVMYNPDETSQREDYYPK